MEQPLRLEIIDPKRGFPSPSPKGTERIAWAPFESACTVVEHALQRKLGDHRVEHLLAPVDALKELTLHLVVTRADFGKFSLSKVVATHGVLTTRWRALLTDQWKVDVETTSDTPPTDVSALFEDVLDDFPTVARPLGLFEKFHGYDDPTIGRPTFRREEERIIVGVTFEPALFPDAAKRLEREITQAIRTRAPDAADLDVQLTTRLSGFSS